MEDKKPAEAEKPVAKKLADKKPGEVAKKPEEKKPSQAWDRFLFPN